MKQTIFIVALMFSSASVIGMPTKSLGRIYESTVFVPGRSETLSESRRPKAFSPGSVVNFNTRKRKAVEIIEIDDEEDRIGKKICASKDTFTYLGENWPSEPKDKYEVYSQFHYETTKNYSVGSSTPTTVVVYPRGNPNVWSDIREIHYAHDVSSQCLANPKADFFRNRNNTCNIVLKRTNVIHGVNEQHVMMEGYSFSTYKVFEYLDSFTDNISRRIYIDKTGLYVVPEENNSVQDTIARYEKKGKLKFENPSSVIMVSASTGDITIGDETITENNFAEKSHNERASLTRTNAIFRKFRGVPHFQIESMNITSKYAAGYKKNSSNTSTSYSAHYKEVIEEFVQKEIILGKARRGKLSKGEREQFIRDGYLY